MADSLKFNADVSNVDIFTVPPHLHRILTHQASVAISSLRLYPAQNIILASIKPFAWSEGVIVVVLVTFVHHSLINRSYPYFLS